MSANGLDIIPIMAIDNVNPYTSRYRLLKTGLLTFTLIVFGANIDLISTSLEDLRILLAVNYQDISVGVAMKMFGCMTAMLFTGYVYDKFVGYSDGILVSANLLILISMYHLYIFFEACVDQWTILLYCLMLLTSIDFEWLTILI